MFQAGKKSLISHGREFQVLRRRDVKKGRCVRNRERSDCDREKVNGNQIDTLKEREKCNRERQRSDSQREIKG